MIPLPFNTPWTDDMVPTAKALVLFVIPYLLGFISASYDGLHIWIALRKASLGPLPDAISSNASIFHKRLHFAMGLVIFVLSPLILLLSSMISARNPEQSGSCGLAALYLGLLFITPRFASRICGVNKVIVHRTPDGGYLKISSIHDSDCDQRHSGIGSLIIISSLMLPLILAVTPEDVISVSIVTAAVVHFVSSSFFGKFSLRAMSELYFLIMLTIAIIMDLQRLHSQRQSGPIKDGLQMPTFSVNYWDRVLFVPAASCSIFVGGLIARMHRFDYQRHLDGTDGNGEIDLVTTPAPTIDTISYCKEEILEGVLVPRWVRAFSKPYFDLALATWSFFRVTIVCLYHREGLGMATPPAAFNMLVLLEFPVIVIVLLLFAALRKEAKALWTYSESWKLSSTVAAISLPPPYDTVGKS